MTSLLWRHNLIFDVNFVVKKYWHLSSIHMPSFTTRYWLHLELCWNNQNLWHLHDRFQGHLVPAWLEVEQVRFASWSVYRVCWETTFLISQPFQSFRKVQYLRFSSSKLTLFFVICLFFILLQTRYNTQKTRITNFSLQLIYKVPEGNKEKN